MDISLFDYELPGDLIAQHPPASRGDSRLMVVDRASGEVRCDQFRNLGNYLEAGDLLVVNNTRVFKARLIGQRSSGGEVEIFLVRAAEDNPLRWQALAQPSRRLAEGERIFFSRKCHTEKLSLSLARSFGEGRWEVVFDSMLTRDRIVERYGHIPLPQYIRRPDEPDDIDRYQTIFARPDQTGAVAAPTAGFHFDSDMLARLAGRGIGRVEITLHVGPGTFKPVSAARVEDHTVDAEWAVLSQVVCDEAAKTKAAGKRVVSVGTTTARTLESAEVRDGRMLPFERDVDLFIRPGHEFRVVDCLLTNFHLPKSSLLILVAAFAGRGLILEAYRRAVAERYRFYSYGDAMLIL